MIFIALLLINTLFSFSAQNYSHLIGMEGFSDQLLKMHFTLYEGYVKNANDLLAKLGSTDPKSYEYGALKRRFGWEFDGMRLHELYFGNLGGYGEPNAKGALVQTIVKQFGSFDQWKQDFIATGMIRGIGWSVLYLDGQSNQLINTWINEHDLGHLAGGLPILVMDVFEHAFMPQFGLDRAKYIDVLYKNIDCSAPEARFSGTGK